MRTISLLPLTALVAVVAGCGSEAGEQAARSVLQRDLTLVPQTSGVQIASPVEMQPLRIQHRTVRPSQRAARPTPAPRSSREPKLRLAAVAASAPVLAAAEPIAQPASTPSTPEKGASPEEGASPANDRELLPGKTVTVIPASSGPSTGSDETDEFPAVHGRTMVVRGGGKCGGRGRGPGIGIAGAPRPDFR